MVGSAVAGQIVLDHLDEVFVLAARAVPEFDTFAYIFRRSNASEALRDNGLARGDRSIDAKNLDTCIRAFLLAA
jgi:hypothetical protein